MVRSREPNFPVFIDERCFINAQSYITSLDYTGPVVLACDDTKLHPSLQVYWDTSISSHILVGTTVHETIAVPDPQVLQELLEKHKNNMATKVRTTFSIFNWLHRSPIDLALVATVVHPGPIDRNSFRDRCGRSNPRQLIR